MLSSEKFEHEYSFNLRETEQRGSQTDLIHLCFPGGAVLCQPGNDGGSYGSDSAEMASSFGKFSEVSTPKLSDFLTTSDRFL